MMKSENAIEVKDLKKSFKVYLDKGSQLKEKILFRSRRRYENREVLKGISFEVKKGEAVALIGHNGCGKSTTLKLLTKIIYPDSGTVEMNGRVSSLIELGAGFHPDMSGRENIFLNASIFGLTREEIEARVDDIIEFSELEDFIDNPVRTYSSGMYMRLAFAVAINVDADILLIDEILAVGDAAFQSKCFEKMKNIKGAGTTIVIVSHSLGQVEQICDRSIWIDGGLIRENGKPRDVHPNYLEYMAEKKEAHEKKNAGKYIDDSNRYGNKKAEITNICLNNQDKKETDVIKLGMPFSIAVEYKINSSVSDAVIGVSIYRNDGILCYGTHTQIDGMDKINLDRDGTIEVTFDKCVLLPGEYVVDFAITENLLPVDYYKNAICFKVVSSSQEVGVVTMSHKWKCDCCGF